MSDKLIDYEINSHYTLLFNFLMQNMKPSIQKMPTTQPNHYAAANVKARPVCSHLKGRIALSAGKTLINVLMGCSATNQRTSPEWRQSAGGERDDLAIPIAFL